MAGSRRSGRHSRVREAASAQYEAAPALKNLTGVLYDSDVIIEILRGNPEIGGAAMSLEQSGVPTYCTAVSWAEVFGGIRPGEEGLTEDFFEARGDVVLDSRTGRRAGMYLASFRKSHGVEVADALVAAAASTSGLRLWTLNRKHYPMKDVGFYRP